jgi:hypothetical protein
VAYYKVVSKNLYEEDVEKEGKLHSEQLETCPMFPTCSTI